MRPTLQMTSILLFIAAIDLASAPVIYGSAKDKEKTSHPVVVDVIVTDGENRPVKDLSQQDFQIFENKKEQQIRSFEVHVQPVDGIVAAPRLPHNTFSNASASETGTINIVLLDQMSTFREDQTLAQRELITYLKQKPQGTRFALFAYRKGDSPCASCDALRMLQGITDDKKLLIGALKDRAAQPQDAILREQIAYEDTSMRALGEIGNFLQGLPGRKQRLWLSDNFDASPVADRGDIWFPVKFKGWQGVDPMSPEQTLHLAASRLAVARVAVYPIDLNGRNKKVEIKRLCNDFAWYWYLRVPTQTEEDANEQVCKSNGIKLNSMAEQSGGAAFHDPGSIRDAIAQAVAEGENYYTLSYIPVSGNSDGKVRTIHVVIDRQGYQVRYLQHYFADDPSTLFRPDVEVAPDIVLPGVAGGSPWRLGQVSSEDPSQPAEPIMAGLRYGGPELKGVIFETRITPNSRPKAATTEQMATLRNYESFRDESAQEEMWHLTKEELKSQNKGKTNLTSLPPPNQVYLQQYWIDFSVPASQINLLPAEEGKQTANLEIAILAFDQHGKKVAGIKETVALSMASSERQEFETSGYHTRETFDVAERAVTLRIAVRDVSKDQIGSMEIPIRAIVNPYKRRRLEIPDSK